MLRSKEDNRIKKIEIELNLTEKYKPSECSSAVDPLASPKPKKTRKDKSNNDLDLLINLYALLCADFQKYSTKWNFLPIVRYLSHENALTRWFATHIIALLFGMKKSELENIHQIYFTQTERSKCAKRFQEICLNSELYTDVNGNQLDGKQRKAKLNDLDIYGDLKYLEFEKLFNAGKMDLASSLVVYVDSTKANMNKLTLSIINYNSIHIEGDLGCGKTTLVSNLAQLTGNKLIKYQMDDYMDSKALIGSYVCSDMPGEFIWKPGPLFEAANNGYWLLLEDIDYATVDSISLLIDLLETNFIRTNDTYIRIHSNFRMFLTQRTKLKRSNNLNYLESLNKLSRLVNFDGLSDADIVQIICKKHANLQTISGKLLDIYKFLNSQSMDVKTKTLMKCDSRTLSLRDLLKLCVRLRLVDNCETQATINAIIQDIIDCFLAFISNKALRNSMSIEIGAFFNVNKDEINAFFNLHKAKFHNTSMEVVCGRVKLKKHLPDDDMYAECKHDDDTFVYTRVALNLLERIARCIECNESVLLCGETGVGKTTILQHLAKLLGKKLTVINLNQQTESSDLLGSFKPINMKFQLKDFKENMEALFQKTFSLNENQTFLSHIHTCYTQNNWSFFMRLAKHAVDSAIKKTKSDRTKTGLFKDWLKLKQYTRQIEQHIEQASNKFTFKFFEGALTKSIVNGDWVILDEINLASSETLQFLGTLLDDEDSSIVLYEKGDNEPIKRHKSFRLFAAMNPASDIGKKNLPISIRNRFTEVYVDELDEKNDLCLMIREYLNKLNPSSGLINTIVDTYFDIKTKVINQLTNGVGLQPIFSLRTLCRALRYASKNPCNNGILSVYDGMCLSFLTDLNRQSSGILENFIRSKLLSGNKNLNVANIQRVIPTIANYTKTHFQKVDEFWILKGENESKTSESFIITQTVRENLKRLARVCSARLPCLIQGDTSIGKTSLIKWLANITGNRLIRINNHENTDLQEYIGSYITNTDGKLEFKEGLLVEAMRHGYWILLDELNLATSDVLEALNRVLDDNRELFIPEIQETVKAHPRFILFATQNPPGKYSGRKQLSRAFRNRFIELHFDELPLNELREIVEKKCGIPNTYSTLLIQTVFELQTHRSQYNGIFAGKNSLITLRDLFRWAERYSKLDKAIKCDDWKQYLAEQGFLMLSGRCRSHDDVKTIHECIEKVFKRPLSISNLDDPQTLCEPIMRILREIEGHVCLNQKNFVWTKNSRRLALLAGLAYKFDEPFLLVGDTGLGKTTICQLITDLNKKYLHIVNCHMHSEASDFLGNIRPARNRIDGSTSNNRLFEWQDGPLLIGIKNGDDFLIDEISLADDSVLERLNSLLESERTLLITENNSSGAIDALHAHKAFRICATMNPSGDFGKKELSPALRNRFLEIWCPTINDISEFTLILDQNLNINNEEQKRTATNVIIQFLEWLRQQMFFKSFITLRDINLWISFINRSIDMMDPYVAIIHGACLVFIDSLNIEQADVTSPGGGAINESSQYKPVTIRDRCLNHLYNSIRYMSGDMDVQARFEVSLTVDFQLSDKTAKWLDYTFEAPTTKSNVVRIMRCLQMQTPVMLEGSPGVGKTTIVQALGNKTGNHVIRINLSEQTDLSELFGADLPAICAHTQSQCFEWRDGPFLNALKQGHWIILDELNLASQSVLEGLNSCFDHRGEIFISELGRKFSVNKQTTKIFACQNPYKQGGGRKGLPKSFLNRFSKVYIDQMNEYDLLYITRAIYGTRIDDSTTDKIIEFNAIINKETCVLKKWGHAGGPWEFNLRDIFRWCDLIVREQTNDDPGLYVNLIYASRFRTQHDRQQVFDIFRRVFGYDAYQQANIADCVFMTQTHLQIGMGIVDGLASASCSPPSVNGRHYDLNRFILTHSNVKYLESILKCIQMDWMCVLVGQSCTGKTSLVRMLASLCGQSLIETSVTNSTDTSDLLGSFTKLYLKHDIYNLLNLMKSNYNQQVCTGVNDKQTFEILCKRMLEIDQLLTQQTATNENFNTEDYKQYIDYIDRNFDRTNQELMRLYESLKAKLDKTAKDNVKFDWQNSSLVEAVKNGKWLLIDNANFCNPSVLDRLNPLLEPNGSLIITEQGCINGQLNEIKAHKDFRLFLCINETFGELSRAMRNRGLEIYLSQVDMFGSDSVNLLRSLFTQNQIESKEFSIDRLLDIVGRLNTNEKKMNFKSTLKLTKLISDYWLYKDVCFDKAIEQAINEMSYPPESDDSKPSAIVAAVHGTRPIYSSNVFKMYTYPIYNHLYKFKYLNEVKRDLNTNRLIDLYDYTAYVQIWFENVAIRHRGLIFDYAFPVVHTTANQLALMALFKMFFCLNDQQVQSNQTCDNSRVFMAFIEHLNGFGNSIDVYEQSFNVCTNRTLLAKLAAIDRARVTRLGRLNMHLSGQLMVFLSKLRMDMCKIEWDSLERMRDTDAKNDYNLDLGLIKQFQAKFYANQVDNFGREHVFDDDYACHRANLIQIENFLLLIKKTFDARRTLPYLKYYWNLIGKSMSTSFHMDTDLKLTTDLIKNHLYFNDVYYNVYLTAWKSFARQVDFLDANENDKYTLLNQFLIEYNGIKTAKNLKGLMDFVNFYDEYESVIRAHSQSHSKAIGHLAEAIEKLRKAVESAQGGQRLDESKLNFVKYEFLPVKYYLDFVRSLKGPVANGFLSSTDGSLPTDIIDYQCSNTVFAKVYRIYVDTCFDWNVFLKLKPILLINADKDSNEGFNSILDKFDTANTSPVSLNVLQYNWYFDYMNRMLCDVDYKSAQLTTLNNYNQTLYNFNTILVTIWSNKALFDFNANAYLRDFEINVRSALDSLMTVDGDYLTHKGYDIRFDQFGKASANMYHRLIGLGMRIAHTYLPMDPLDPYIYDNLNEQNRTDTTAIFQNEIDKYQNMNELNNGVRDVTGCTTLIKALQAHLASSHSQPVASCRLSMHRDNNSNSYYEIKREFEHILVNVCSFDTLNKFIGHFECQTTTAHIDAKHQQQQVDMEYKTWHLTVNNFIKYIAKKYNRYADIVYAFVSGLGVVAFGLNTLYTQWHVTMQARRNAKQIEIVQALLSYPTGPLCHTNTVDKLIDYGAECNGNNTVGNRALLIALMNIHSTYYEDAQGDPHQLTRILEHFSQVYQANLDGKLADQVNTYKYKKYGQQQLAADNNDNDDDDNEIHKIFPSYLTEFNEFEFIKETFEKGQKRKPIADNVDNVDNADHKALQSTIKTFKQVYNLIKSVVARRTATTSLNDTDNIELIVLKTFFESYKFASDLMQTDSLHFLADHASYNISHMLFVCLLKQFNRNFQINEDHLDVSRTPNIYTDSNVDEIVKCKRVLDQLQARLDVLLAEFPNNSMLVELVQVIRRIGTFNINDTLIKYLTGLELVVRKAQNWQLIAAKQYALDVELKLISDLIIDWRKLELNYWKQLLTIELEQIEDNCGYVWFFHVYTVCLQFKCADTDETYETLMQFMSMSPLGEFRLRLGILGMCFDLFKTSVQDKQSVCEILWNVLKYYEIFDGLVESEISKCKNEIEAEINDYIRICRWQDMNYWALKQSIDKSHKTLFKFIRKFREQMQVNCSPYLSIARVNRPDEIVADVIVADRIASAVEPHRFALSTTQVDYGRYYSTMRRFVKCLGSVRVRQDFLTTLNDLTCTLNERFDEFKKATRDLFKMTKNTKELKDSYKKNIKNLQLQKSKTLDDLLGLLKFIGLSYRKGNISYSKANDRISGILRFKPITKPNQAINHWPSTEHVYYALFTRYLCYKTANLTKTDANRIKIEQLNGYIEHFMYIVNKQKSSIHNVHDCLNTFAENNLLIRHVAESSRVVNGSGLVLNELFQLNSQLKQFTQQLAMLCRCLTGNDTPIGNDDEYIKQVKTNVDLLNASVDAIKNLTSQLTRFHGRPYQHIFDYQNDEFFTKLNDLLGNLQTRYYACDQNLKGFDEIYVVFDEIRARVFDTTAKLMNHIVQVGQPAVHRSHANDENSEFLVCKIINKILKTIETFYKKYACENGTDNGDQQQNDSYLSFDFKPNALVEICERSFTDDLENMNLTDLNKLIDTYLANLGNGQNDADFAKLLFCFSDLYESFLMGWLDSTTALHLRTCECFNSMAFVFGEIKANGFCTPNDIDDTDEDPNNNGDEKSHTDKFNLNDEPAGLGDGEGQKDVSDQIENEDQLDDTKQANNEDKEKNAEDEEKDKVKEEKNGIEMTDDFDEQLQDVEMKEEDEEAGDDEKDDENEELDDELGDVDDDQDLLDDRLWGGDDDQDDDKKPNDEVDPKKGGELDDKGEDEYGAKQDDLPMIDKSKDEAKETDENNDEDDQERPDANEINENSDDDFDDKEQDDKSREQKNGDPEKPEEEMQIDMDKTDKDDQGENEDDECDQVDLSEDQDQGQDNTEAVESETEDADAKDNDDNALNSKDYNTTERKQAGKSDQNKQDQAMPMEDMDDDNETVEDNARQDKTETTIDESIQTKNAQNSTKQERVSNKTNQTTTNDKANEQKRQNRPKQDENRIVGDEKKLTRNKNERIVDDNDEDDDNEDGNNENAQDFKHIKDENKKPDKQLPDSATNDQKQQLNIVDETDDENMLEDDAIMSDVDENSDDRSQQANIRHKDLEKQNKEKNKRQADKDNKETVEKLQQMDLADDHHHDHHTSHFHTNYDCLYDMDKFRLEVENKLDVLRHRTDVTATCESLELWHAYEVLTQQLSKELCEQLRLILEPTKCTKLKGDYKTGKRLNMKRVVEYIATEYRKDKIWLRRTQPNNRNYQILLAVDNSSSMADNHCMQLAYETIATLTNAFNYLQVGQFGLLSFGENVSTLHEFFEPLSSDMGAKVFSQLNFNDNKTCIAQLLNYVNEVFESNPILNTESNSNSVSKLLIVLSDGRGIFYEGIDLVKKAVQKCLQQKIFIVFVILDIPGKTSVFDIRMSVTSDDNKLKLTSYMEHFPFPFYIVLRDINNLSIVMIEALKQWFDLVTKVN